MCQVLGELWRTTVVVLNDERFPQGITEPGLHDTSLRGRA